MTDRLVKGYSAKADLARRLIHAAYEAGIPPPGTMKAIAARTGLSPQRVTNLARQLGLTRSYQQSRYRRGMRRRTREALLI